VRLGVTLKKHIVRRSPEFVFIDTPGMDDTDGDDVTNMFKIISYLKDEPTITCVLFIVKHGPLTKTFQDVYCSIRNSFKVLESSFVVLVTHSPFGNTNTHLEYRNGFEKYFTTLPPMFFVNFIYNPNEEGSGPWWFNCYIQSLLSNLLSFMAKMPSYPVGEIVFHKPPSLIPKEHQLRDLLNVKKRVV